jgi:hypothetical protein
VSIADDDTVDGDLSEEGDTSSEGVVCGRAATDRVEERI